MLAKLAYWELALQLIQTLLFILRNVLHYEKPYMETIGYECLFLVLQQSVFITL